MAAAYSELLLAGIQVFGDQRSASFPSLPKWRRHARRPSCLDLITLLREEITQAHKPLPGLAGSLDWKNLGKAAAA